MTYRHLSEFKLPKIVITCSCGRKGRYGRDRAIEQHGDIRLCDFIDSIVRTCPQWREDQDKSTCRGGCDDLVYMFSDLPELKR